MTATSLPTPEPRRRRRYRGALVVLVVALGAVLTVLVSDEATETELDPNSPKPAGAKALVSVLREQGVSVRVARTNAEAIAAATAGSTLLVTRPDFLGEGQAARVAESAADVVYLAPGGRELRELGGITLAGQDGADERSPGQCDLVEGARAGAIDGGGLLYRGGTGPRCYSASSEDDGQAYGLVRVSDGGRARTVFGNPELLTNDRIDERGNAALALGLLGARDTLIWYAPDASDIPADAGQDTPWSLLPAGIRYGVGMIGVTLVLLALWQGRRLGPVLPEPLPVVVRAAETTEGRARLYQRTRARGRAAQVLREGARERLRELVGLERHYAPAALLDAVAARSGRAPGEVGALLAGPDPDNDEALVALADDLHHLEREVARL